MFPAGIKLKDADLVQKIRLGDSRAMRTLYSRHSQRLYTLAIRLTGNKTDAEEVVQDSFVKAWRNIAVGTSKSQFHKARAQMRQHLKKTGMEKRI